MPHVYAPNQNKITQPDSYKKREESQSKSIRNSVPTHKQTQPRTLGPTQYCGDSGSRVSIAHQCSTARLLDIKGCVVMRLRNIHYLWYPITSVHVHIPPFLPGKPNNRTPYRTRQPLPPPTQSKKYLSPELLDFFNAVDILELSTLSYTRV